MCDTVGEKNNFLKVRGIYLRGTPAGAVKG
jgi:hypothetical protein